VGFEIQAASLPVSTAAREAGRALGADPLQWALNGGEDYQLLFTAPPSRAGLVTRQMPRLTGTTPRLIGRAVARQKGVTLVKGGKSIPLKPRGWDHFR
jgi:thiamine-monophosphate kinase